MNIKRMIPHGKVDCYRYIAIALLAVLPLVSYSEERLMQPVEDVFLEEIAPVWLNESPTVTDQPKAAVSTDETSNTNTKMPPQNTVIVSPQAFAIRESVKAESSSTEPSTNVLPSSTTESLPAEFSIDELIKSAQQGHKEAQYQLGMRYQYGDDVPVNLNKANQWLTKAATAGDARSQHALAMFYQQYATNIEGAKKALLWEKKAADRGSADAQYALGVMFKNGRLVRKNEAEARKWLAMAAQQGHLSAQLVLQE